MARKRLSPANPDFLETKSARPPVGGGRAGAGEPGASGPSRAPIAEVARDASSASALVLLGDELERMRDDGLIVMQMPLDAVTGDHLERDRLSQDDEDMRSLMKSIETHGQRSPIEVMAIDQAAARSAPYMGRHYGLISGHRRLSALRDLHRLTGERRFGTVLALVRRPQDSAEAYVSMVEENEIRVGLSYFERARVAAETTRAGVFETEKQALLQLFASASRAKRSRIRAFVELYHALGDMLRFPSALAERPGLEVIYALRADPGLAPRLRDALRRGAPDTADAELAILTRVMKERPPQDGGAPADAAEFVPHAEHLREVLANGLVLELKGKRITLRGSAVDEALFRRVLDALT